LSFDLADLRWSQFHLSARICDSHCTNPRIATRIDQLRTRL
jgi:hypothetical protein